MGSMPINCTYNFILLTSKLKNDECQIAGRPCSQISKIKMKLANMSVNHTEIKIFLFDKSCNHNTEVIYLLIKNFEFLQGFLFLHYFKNLHNILLLATFNSLLNPNTIKGECMVHLAISK